MCRRSPARSRLLNEGFRRLGRQRCGFVLSDLLAVLVNSWSIGQGRESAAVSGHEGSGYRNRAFLSLATALRGSAIRRPIRRRTVTKEFHRLLARHGVVLCGFPLFVKRPFDTDKYSLDDVDLGII